MNHAAPSLLPVAQTPPQLYCQLIDAGWDAASLPRIRDACLLAAVETRHLLRGSGKPFSCHLVGVASLVAEATGDADLTVAALLHALSQERVMAGQPERAHAETDADASRVRFDGRVGALLQAYAGAGDLAPDAAEVDAADPAARDLRILQLADQLEDGLDGGPWWHGAVDDSGSERGSAADRVSRLRALDRQFAQAPALGAPILLHRYEAVMASWRQGRWPAGLRSGWYSSHAPAPEGVARA